MVEPFEQFAPEIEEGLEAEFGAIARFRGRGGPIEEVPRAGPSSAHTLGYKEQLPRASAQFFPVTHRDQRAWQ